MGPPPTSHFHVLTDTPSGLVPVNPAKTQSQTPGKTLLDVDRKPPGATTPSDKKEPDNNNFGLKLDQYVR